MSAQPDNQQAAQGGTDNIDEVADDATSEEGAFVVPDSLVDEEVWACYCRRDEQKIPTSPLGVKPRYIDGSSPDSKHAVTFEKALSTVEQSRQQLPRGEAIDGVMLLLSESDAMALDLDGVVDPETGEMDDLAVDLVEDLDNLFWELSPSSSGLHGYGLDSGGLDQSVKQKDSVEVYSARGMTFTGRNLKGTNDDVPEVNGLFAVYQRLYNELKDTDDGGNTDDVVDDEAEYEPSSGGLSAQNEELVDAMISHDETAEKLYNRGDSMSLAQFGGDRSRADMSLASKISWWADSSGMLSDNDYTEGDIISVFMGSDLAQRTKVQTRSDYVRITVRKAR